MLFHSLVWLLVSLLLSLISIFNSDSIPFQPLLSSPFPPILHPITLTPHPGVFGLQIASTTLYAYVSDCYKPQTPETGVLFNLSRGLSFVVGYFVYPLVDTIGYTWTWFIFAVVLFLFFVPVGALIWWGERWRERWGRPSFHGWL